MTVECILYYIPERIIISLVTWRVSKYKKTNLYLSYPYLISACKVTRQMASCSGYINQSLLQK